MGSRCIRRHSGWRLESVHSRQTRASTPAANLNPTADVLVSMPDKVQPSQFADPPHAVLQTSTYHRMDSLQERSALMQEGPDARAHVYPDLSACIVCMFLHIKLQLTN